MNFAIDIGTGRCVSYNFDKLFETQNITENDNFNNQTNTNTDEYEEKVSLYEFSVFKEVTDYWKEKDEYKKERRAREPLWWKLMPIIVFLSLLTSLAFKSLP